MSDCICKIINKEIPSKTVYEDDQIIIPWPTAQAPVHVLVFLKAYSPMDHVATDDAEVMDIWWLR